MKKRTLMMLCKKPDLAKSKVLCRFDLFDPKDRAIMKGTPECDPSARRARWNFI